MTQQPLNHPIILGTRPSRLARWQTDHAIALLQAAYPGLECRTVTFVTHGDKTLDRPLPEIGGKGVFTEELESALRRGEIDLAVHSLKDLPIEGAPDLAIGAICEREDARDALVSCDAKSLQALPPGARVGTSSLRRSAQVLAIRPDARILPLRGNVDTRVKKAMNGEYEAIILAAAGLVRLEMQAAITAILPYDVMLPAPGQGAMAVQCRAGDRNLLEVLQAIDHQATRLAVTAERAFLKALGGGCSAPVAARAHVVGDILQMDGLVGSLDGRMIIREAGSGEDPDRLGADMGRAALAHGAAEVLRGFAER